MNYSLPLKIKKPFGEELIFHRMEMDQGEEKLIIENFLAPGTQRVKHTFYMQDEYLIVLHGKLGYQIKDQAPKFIGIGETIFFKRGTPHSLWNAGSDELNCFGWIKPANNIIFYLSSLYQPKIETKAEESGQFENAYLLYRYRKEFDIQELSKFTKSIVLPATYGIGKITGKYRKFKNAPAPLK